MSNAAERKPTEIRLPKYYWVVRVRCEFETGLIAGIVHCQLLEQAVATISVEVGNRYNATDSDIVYVGATAHVTEDAAERELLDLRCADLDTLNVAGSANCHTQGRMLCIQSDAEQHYVYGMFDDRPVALPRDPERLRELVRALAPWAYAQDEEV